MHTIAWCTVQKQQSWLSACHGTEGLEAYSSGSTHILLLLTRSVMQRSTSTSRGTGAPLRCMGSRNAQIERGSRRRICQGEGQQQRQAAA